MFFKNVYWNDCVGNLEILDDKIIFYDDKMSMNDFNCKKEIPINRIDKKKLKKDLLDMKKPLTICIEYDKTNFEFSFVCDDDYKKFIREIQSIL